MKITVDIVLNILDIFSVDKFCTSICGGMDKNWTKVLKIIKDQVNIANYHTWFAKTDLLEKEGEVLIIGVPSSFVKENISKFLPALDKAVEEVFGQTFKLEFKVIPSLRAKEVEEEGIDLGFIAPQVNHSQAGLNPKYTIKNYMVGLSNNLAYAAAQAVINNPGLSYNPLFIYGGTGVGKTHLMQGIGNALLEKNPRLRVIYCPLERFMNDFVQSIQNKKMGDFRAKYRNCDLFLIDDVQFISGRDAMMEEFFHTFNDLQTKNSQIILTSDRPPQEIQKLEGRLASRFQGGLMVDIQLPDFDTRVAILKAKCAESGDQIEEKLLTLIAENMNTNARELEGKLIQIIQSAKLTGKDLTEDFVREKLGQSKPTSQKLDHKKVVAEVNKYFNIKMADMTGPRRKKELVLPRQLAMYLLYEECKIPYERIGELLGGRDHTTILHGVEKMREVVNRDREVQRILIELKQALVG